MAENQILPFAQGQGANVLSQADYAGDSMRLQGHQPGVARSALENKALLQCSSMAAGLAQFIADGQADDVTDEKTPAEIAAMMAAATVNAIPLASDTLAGLARFATQQEVGELAVTNAAITPDKLQYAFNSNTLRTILPNGWAMEYGMPIYTAGAGDNLSVRVTFPIAFTAAPFVMVGIYGDSNAAAGGLTAHTSTHDKTGFNIIFRRGNNALLNGALQASWLAIGKVS